MMRIFLEQGLDRSVNVGGRVELDGCYPKSRGEDFGTAWHLARYNVKKLNRKSPVGCGRPVKQPQVRVRL